MLKEKNIINVSVIIPIYNTEQYLKQCLDSIINQTFKDIEIICINDCSTDNSLQIIKEYQLKDERFVLIDLKQNNGQGYARNEGLKIAKGKYIVFVDSDDWVSNNYIEFLYTQIEKYNLDMVSAEAFFYDNNTNCLFKKHLIPADILNKTEVKKLLLLHSTTLIIPVWTKIYRKKFLLDNNIHFLCNWHEDNFFIFKTLVKTTKFKFMENKIYYYRVNRNNSTMEFLYKNFTYFKLFKDLKQMLTEEKLFDQYKDLYYQYITRLTASKLTILTSQLSTKKLTFDFYKFKKLYYNKDFVKNFTVRDNPLSFKIVLILFYLSLKLNINYIIVVKFCKKINFIKIIKEKIKKQ